MTSKTVRWIAAAGTLLAAILVAWLATRSAGTDAAANEHAHGAAAGGDTAIAVMLSADEARRIGVTYAVAAISPLRREIRIVGQVTFDERRSSTIAPKIDGWVEQLHVNFTGQFVRAGDPLLAIYSPMLVTAQEELLLAKRLLADVAGGSPDVRRNAEDLLASARRRLAWWDVAPSDISRIEATGEIRRTLTLRVPTTGFVVEKNVVAGQRIMAGEPLYRIADLGTVWVEGEVFEQDLPSVRLGQQVSAELQAIPGRPFTGRITYVYPTLNPDTRTVRVRVELSNAGLLLKPGMYATLRIVGISSGSVIAVPRTAVLSTGERDLVFVKRADGMLEPRIVTLGMVGEALVQVLAGITPGDTVVASATFLVDAESNLGAVMGGMGNMPGMDMTAPTSPDPPRAAPAPKRAVPDPGTPPPTADHAGHGA